MKKRSRRQVKKLHRRWLDAGVIDASQASYWRSRLFDSRAGEVFEISRADLSGLPLGVALAIQKFALRFSVTVANPAEAEPWLRDGLNNSVLGAASTFARPSSGFMTVPRHAGSLARR